MSLKVTHQQIVTRGLTNCCPNCGAKTLFKPGTWFDLAEECTACGMKIEKDEGFFLGAMAINYGVTLVAYLTPVVILWYLGVLGGKTAVIAALIGAMVVPALLYRSSRSWQLMLYYTFLPQHLPANRRALSALEDENI